MVAGKRTAPLFFEPAAVAASLICGLVETAPFAAACGAGGRARVDAGASLREDRVSK